MAQIERRDVKNMSDEIRGLNPYDPCEPGMGGDTARTIKARIDSNCMYYVTQRYER